MSCFYIRVFSSEREEDTHRINVNYVTVLKKTSGSINHIHALQIQSTTRIRYLLLPPKTGHNKHTQYEFLLNLNMRKRHKNFLHKN